MINPDFLQWKSILSEEESLRIDSIYNDMCLDVQKTKMKNHNIPQKAQSGIIEQLKVRPKILSSISKYFGAKTAVEVGTAQGMQSVVFSEISGCKCYTCDLVDVRNARAKNDLVDFTLGNSLAMSNKIEESFDIAWIDGAHDHYSVVFDFVALRKKAHEKTAWVFDDFDQRFGCFHDISSIAAAAKENYVIDLGFTGSGQPNRIVVCLGL